MSSDSDSTSSDSDRSLKGKSRQYLWWIDDDKFTELVKQTVQPSKSHKKQIHDPFVVLAERHRDNINHDEFERRSMSFRLRHNIAMKTGDFHTHLLAHVPGWKEPKKTDGYKVDLMNLKMTKFIEVKNRDSTTNARGKEAAFDTLQTLCNKYPNSCGYMAQIIMSEQCDRPYYLPQRKRDKRVREIDGRTLYKIVTGRDDAFAMTLKAFGKCLGRLHSSSQQEISPKDLSDLSNKAYGTYSTTSDSVQMTSKGATKRTLRSGSARKPSADKCAPTKRVNHAPVTLPQTAPKAPPKGACTSIELFAGCGGLALGLERAGFHNSMLVEMDKHCCNTLRANRPDWNVVNDDISKVIFKDFSGKVDIVTGGVPCQAFSVSGKREGLKDDRGNMFRQFFRCLKEVQPKLFVIENVEGLLSHDGGNTLKYILRNLASCGYIVKYRLLNAVDYGVAQKRKRVIFIGLHRRYKAYERYLCFPEPTTADNPVPIREVLKRVPKSDGQEYSAAKAKVIALVPPGGCWVDLPKRIQKSYMKGSYNSGGGKRGICRRISWDEPSLTLTTSPSQKQTERAHPAENRPFTTREYARIQSFPDDWKFTGGMTSVYRQIGNAVPVTFAEHISRAMMALLKRIRAGEEKHRSSKREVSSSDDSDSDANDSSDDASSSSDSDA